MMLIIKCNKEFKIHACFIKINYVNKGFDFVNIVGFLMIILLKNKFLDMLIILNSILFVMLTYVFIVVKCVKT